ncbi:MAG: hypothetical protein COB37_09020 [Kordiimonadales bacterium]|nr:MAG: hypothetical protein COB37_09020 [Kordiimonadales bacterium]
MQNKAVLIGTYHKTGTVWMLGVFERALAELGLPFVRENIAAILSAGQSAVFFQDHCRFDRDLITAETRGFRMIRDPRDVVISAAHYHTKSDEKWLHVAREKFGNKTYHQAINAKEGWHEKYRFEMQPNWGSGSTIRKMVLDKVLECDAFRTVRYETMIDPVGGDVAFSELLKFLGFEAGEQAVIMARFKDNRLANIDAAAHSHVRSGKTAQWRTKYTKALAEDFIAIHGDALIALGYETDHAWADTLPD